MKNITSIKISCNLYWTATSFSKLGNRIYEYSNLKAITQHSKITYYNDENIYIMTSLSK